MRLQGIKIRLSFTLSGLLLIAMLLVNLVGVIFWKRDALQREAKLDQTVLFHVTKQFSNNFESFKYIQSNLSFDEFYPASEKGQFIYFWRHKKNDKIETRKAKPFLASAVAQAALGQQVSLSSISFADILEQNEPVLVSAHPIIREKKVIGVVAVTRSLKPLVQTLWQAEKIILGYIIVNLLVLAVVGFFRMAKLIVRPIEQLVQLADQYTEQEEAWFIAENSGSEFNQLSKSLNMMLIRIGQDRTFFAGSDLVGGFNAMDRVFICRF
ncbi:MAG: HAMP domain-containing protein [Candidatus Electrothrix sp. AR3]|nr:HAMP domain-containing protein [Candidatus Electrothrix sp. AR3]